MNRLLLCGLALLGSTLVAIALASMPLPAGSTAAPATTAPSLTSMRQQLARSSVPFVVNGGQWDSRAVFAAQTFAGTLFVTTDGKLVYSLPRAGAAASSDPLPWRTPHKALSDRRIDSARSSGWVITESFVDAGDRPRAARPRGMHPATAKVSYFIGNDQNTHHPRLATFERIDLGQVFEGVEVQLRATNTNVEKIFTVAPHHDAASIRIRVEGADRLELSANGELIAVTGNGPVTYTAPVAFQQDDEGRLEPVGVRYVLDAASASYGFVPARYDRARPLVIDPLLQSSYAGAAGDDYAFALAIHPLTGDIYIAGSTSSTGSTFPGVSGGAYSTYGGGTYDAFVSRFSADLTTLHASTYLGAAGSDQAFAVAIHPVTGDVYVAGDTGSDGATFPGVTGGAPGIGTYGGGQFDGFVSRLSADLGTLFRSTYLGGAADDNPKALAVHPVSGEMYVTGKTNSTSFPGTFGGFQAGWGGNDDVFVTRFSADLVTPLQSTYLGGTGLDGANAIAIHPHTGDVYVAGYSAPLAGSVLPGSSGSAQSSPGGNLDAIVAAFSADLKTLRRATYLGGAGSEQAYALAIHPMTGDIYAAGYTDSAAFPGLNGSAQTIYGGGFEDAFVSRLNAELTTLVRSSYFGGSFSDTAYALAIHPLTGEVHVGGNTNSPTLTGVGGGAQSSPGGNGDGFVTRFVSDLSSVPRSTFLGVGSSDQIRAIAIDVPTGMLYVAGITNAPNSTFPAVAGGARDTYGGGQFDAFVSRLTPDLQAGDVVPNTFAFDSQSGVPISSLRTSSPVQIGGLGALATVTASGALASAICVSTTNSCSCNATPGGTFSTAPVSVANNQHVCVRHLSAPVADTLSETIVIVGGGTAKFATFTGNLFGNCSLDVDGNRVRDALTDGLILIRALFGLTGSSVTNNAIGANATRTTWEQIRPYLNGNCGTNFGP
jgi:hypothetical protein